MICFSITDLPLSSSDKIGVNLSGERTIISPSLLKLAGGFKVFESGK